MLKAYLTWLRIFVTNTSYKPEAPQYCHIIITNNSRYKPIVLITLSIFITLSHSSTLSFPLPIMKLTQCSHYHTRYSLMRVTASITHYSFIELSSVPITSTLLGSFRQFSFSLIIITKQHRLLRVVCTLSSHIGLMVTHKGSNCALHCRNTLHSLKTQTILTTSDQ